MITSGLTLLIANLANISSMATMGSTGLLVIFAAVNAANGVLAEETKSKRSLSFIGVGLCLSALGCLIWQTANSNSPGQLWFLLAMTGAAFFLELTFRLITGRKMNFLNHN